MDKAKQAVSSFISKAGGHKTTIDEDVRKPVTDKHVFPQQHEEVTTVVDREVHQHHHQTAIQPIKATETLPTQHTAKTLAVEKRIVNEGNDEDLKTALAKDEAKYTNLDTMHDTNYTTSQAPVTTGEHIHHHIHQHVQPVVQKEVIQPKVVHTTMPVHEVHNAAPVHHQTTTLPAKTMDEFTKDSGALEPRSAKKITEYDGCPTAKDKNLRNDKRTHEAIHGH